MCDELCYVFSSALGIRKLTITSPNTEHVLQARDRGTPFSSTLAYVQPGRDIPLNSITATYVFCMLLSLINLGSAVALNIITSLGTGALLSSYIVSVSCIILKRLRGEPLLPRRWSLGKWGLPINIISVLFMILCFVMNFFPQSPHGLTAETFNWNIVIVSTNPLMTDV
jgi:choline transport protein